MLITGNEAVLGPLVPPGRPRQDVYPEMLVSRDKLRPGSGMLSVKVIPDGPTRVLQITDINFQVTFYTFRHTSFSANPFTCR